MNLYYLVGLVTLTHCARRVFLAQAQDLADVGLVPVATAMGFGTELFFAPVLAAQESLVDMVSRSAAEIGR
jgi:hypothetical protein